MNKLEMQVRLIESTRYLVEILSSLPITAKKEIEQAMVHICRAEVILEE